jgi:dTDP-4-amino-4,6-dideoxygalactose transaminase
MTVPLLDLTAQNSALEVELREAFEEVLRSGQYINGPDVAEFEREVAEFVGAKHAIGVSSGTDAILLALMALEVKPGDEVLCPSFTFFATAGCVARLGGTPVFVDSDPATFNIDIADARRKVTRRSKVIIPVHLFGQCADMDAVNSFAAEHELHVIEDAAQSLGARFKGRFAGSMGTFGTYSFFPSKNLGGLGDAGMLVCQDDALAEKARILRNHGMSPKYYHKYVGGNFRLDTLQAAFLRPKLRRLAAYNERRAANATVYLRELATVPGLILPAAHPECEHIWNQFTIRVTNGHRDRLRFALQQAGVSAEIYYPLPLHRQECFRGNQPSANCPVADLLSTEVLSLPIFPELSRDGLERVAGELRAAANGDAQGGGFGGKIAKCS